ncbi:MAG: flippase [Terracidiphilus sp.]|jgi:O-antigen/teichoic acid export membrane protein
MSRLGAVLKNTGYLALAETAKPVLSFLLILVISRTLGRDGMGSYTIILTFTALFELIATLGLGTMIVRGIAADSSRLSFYVSGAIGVAVLSSAVVLPAMLAVVHFLNYPPEVAQGIRILTWTLLISILQQYALSVCEGVQNMRLRAVLSVADTAGRLIAGVFMIRHGYGVLGIIEGMVLVRAITTLIAFVAIGAHTSLSLDFRAMFRSCWTLMLAGLPFLLMTIASAAFWSVNTLLLSKLVTVENVGIYNAGSRITDILKTLLFSYQIALLPMLSASFVRSREQFRQECDASIKYLALLTVPIATGVSALASRIIPLVFGHSFDPAVPILQVLVWTVCIFSIAMVFARALIASHNQMLDLYSNLAALTVNILLGWRFIHSYGPVGAAYATLVSLIAFAILEYWLVSNKLFRPHILVPVLRAVGGSLFMAFVVIHMQALPLGVAILLGALVYLIALICLGTFSLNEIRTARGLISNWVGEVLLQRGKRAPAEIL